MPTIRMYQPYAYLWRSFEGMSENWQRRLVIPQDAKLEQIIDLLNSMELHINLDTANPVLVDKFKDWMVEKDMKV